MMSDEERQRIIDDYYYNVQNGIPITKDMFDAFKDAQTGIKGLTAAQAGLFKALGKAVTDTTKAMYNGKQGAEVMADGVETVTDALEVLGITLMALGGPLGLLAGALGVAVGALGKYNKAASQQADALFKTYKDLSATGQSAAGGITEIFASMQKFGYGIEQLGDMTALLKENSAALASFGGTAASGAKAFANAAGEIQRSDIGESLQRLGKTPDDINKGIAAFVKQQQQSGISSANINKDLAARSAAYIKNLDVLSKLTGESADKMQDQIDAALAEDAFNQTIYELRKKEAAGDKEAGRLADEYIKTAAQLVKTPQVQKEFFQGVGGDISAMTKTFMVSADAVGLIGTKAFSSAKFLDTFKKDADQFREAIGGAYKLNALGDVAISAKELSIVQSRYADETAKNQEERAKAEQELQQKGLDPNTAAMIKLRIQQMNARDELQSFVQAGVAPATEAMAALAGVTNAAAGVANKVMPGAETPGGGKAIGGGKTESAPGGKAGATVVGGVAGAALGYGAGVLGGAEAGAALGGGIGALFGGVGAVPGALIGGALGATYGGIAGLGLGGALGAGLGHTFGGSTERQSTTSQSGGGQGPQALLDYIGGLESHGDYNVLVGGAKADLTNMTVQDVMAMQSRMRQSGYESTAVGKYQIIQSTLAGLIDKAGVSKDAKFDKTTQDKLGMALLDQAGYQKYKQGQLDPNQFADKLAGIWASLPTQSGKSAYQGVGSNTALTDRASLIQAVQKAEFGGIVRAKPGGTNILAGEAGSDEAFVPLVHGKIPVDIKDSAFMKEFVKGITSSMGPDRSITDIASLTKIIATTINDYKSVQPAGGELTRNVTVDPKLPDSLNNFKSVIDSFVNTKLPDVGAKLNSVMPDFSKMLPVNDIATAIADKINMQTAKESRPVAVPPVQDNTQQLALMSQQLTKLDELVRVMNNQLSVSTKIMQYQH
jgi:muramidase (phage lysozyme)